MNENKSPIQMSDGVYTQVKYITQIALPAIGTLYFALSQIWGLLWGPEVVGTITAVDAFLGVMLALSTKAYNNSGDKYDGSIDLVEDEGTKTFVLSLDSDPYDLENQEEVIFKINKAETPDV